MLNYGQSLAKIKNALSENQHSFLFRIYKFDEVKHSVSFMGARTFNNDHFYDRNLEQKSLGPIFSVMDYFHRTNGLVMKKTLKIIYHSKIHQAFQHFTGLDPWIVLNCSRIRALKNDAQSARHPEKIFIPWHRDARVSENRNIMTVWIPDITTGTTVPGLSFYRTEKGEDMECLLNSKAKYDLDFTDKELEEANGYLETPQTNIGDALIFGKDVIHKTQTSIENWHSRNTIELRLSNPKIWEEGVKEPPFISVMIRPTPQNDQGIDYFVTHHQKLLTAKV